MSPFSLLLLSLLATWANAQDGRLRGLGATVTCSRGLRIPFNDSLGCAGLRVLVNLRVRREKPSGKISAHLYGWYATTDAKG